jgi:hypothetical protein
MDCRGIRDEKQLLPYFFGGPARDGIDQRVQDSVPSLVVYKLDPLVLVQLRDHVSRRIEVVQNWVVAGKSLEVGSGYLCA